MLAVERLGPSKRYGETEAQTPRRATRAPLPRRQAPFSPEDHVTTTTTSIPTAPPSFAPSGSPEMGSTLATAHAQLATAAEILGYDEGLRRMLATPRREIHVAV